VSLEREGSRRSYGAGGIQQRRRLHRHALAADARTRPGLEGAEFADGYGYDARVLPRKNVMLTTSFTGWKNLHAPFRRTVQDAEAMKQFGNSMVLWNFHTRQPKKAFHVPGAPLEIRWAWGEKNNYAFTATALTSKLWLCYEDKNGRGRRRKSRTSAARAACCRWT
jgi:methanethiol oxidase